MRDQSQVYRKGGFIMLKIAQKFLVLPLILAIFICSGVTSFAMGTPAKSKAAPNCTAAVSHTATSVTASSSAHGNSSITRITIKMELQKKNGSSYSTVKTWSSTTNSSSASMRKTAVVSSKATYRVKTIFTLYSSNGKETITKIAY